MTGSAAAAGAGASLPRAATFAGDRGCAGCATGDGEDRCGRSYGCTHLGHDHLRYGWGRLIADRGRRSFAAEGQTAGARGGAATGAGSSGASLRTVEMVVTLTGLETTGAGTS